MFQQQLDGFAQDQHNLRAHVSNLTRDYQALIGEVQNFRRTFASHDHLIQNLINVCARHERPPPGQSNNEEEAHQTQELQSLISAYNESARASHNQLDQISESRPSLVSGRLLSGNRPSPSPRIGEASIAQSQPEHQHFPQHERPQQQQQQQHIPRQQPIQQPQQPQGQTVPPGRSGGTQPNWSVRPKVLLVEDDPISRKLSSKFLEVLGCSIEVAEDGVNAVNKMNSEKFDLVFMVRL